MDIFRNVPPITSTPQLVAAATAASIFTTVACGQFARDVYNGHYLDASITGVGCAGATLIGAMAAVKSYEYFHPTHVA